MDTRGAQFTWSNRRKSLAHTEKRLDRGICNDDWLEFWSSSSCCTLTRNQSDHFPLLLDFKNGSSLIHSSFIFQSMWIDHVDCGSLIEEVWAKPVLGCHMFVLAQKLRNLKDELRIWNKNIFGNVHHKVIIAQESLDSIQKQTSEVDYSNSLHDLELKAQVDLNQALHFQERFWREKASLN